jgi:hypothetical protein
LRIFLFADMATPHIARASSKSSSDGSLARNNLGLVHLIDCVVHRRRQVRDVAAIERDDERSS